MSTKLGARVILSHIPCAVMDSCFLCIPCVPNDFSTIICFVLLGVLCCFCRVFYNSLPWAFERGNKYSMGRVPCVLTLPAHITFGNIVSVVWAAPRGPTGCCVHAIAPLVVVLWGRTRNLNVNSTEVFFNDG
ncbi:unnamed protein product [Ectocarpus fasciculatus]